MPPWTLITPASRGLGHALARHLLRTTQAPLVATTRRDADQLRESLLQPTSPDTYLRPTDTAGGPPGRTVSEETAHLLAAEAPSPNRLHVLHLDVHDESSIAAAAEECKALFPTTQSDASASHLRLAILLPGVLYPEKSPAQLDADKILDTLKTNLGGPLLLLKHFAQFLPKKATEIDEVEEGLPRQAVWASLSARVGSIADNSLGGWYSYRATKAGVAQVSKTFDNYLKMAAGDKALAVSLHPGTVKTGLSREFWANVQQDKLFRPEYSAEKLMGVLQGLGPDQRGRTWDWKGEEVPP